MANSECPTDEELGRFLDGTLVAGDAHRVKTHVAECPRCRASLDTTTESHLQGRAERLWRWSQQNKLIAAVSVAAGALLLMAVGALVASVILSRARSDAQDAATLARQQRDQALETLNRLVHVANEKFEGSVTNIDEIRKTVLDISVDGLLEIARTADHAGLADVSTAAVHLRLGMVLTRLGRYSEAREHFDKGDTLLAALGGESSRQWPVVRHLIESRWFRSDLANELEDYGRCSAHLESAAEIARTALARWNDEFETRFTLARSESRLADHYMDREDPRVEEALARALTVFDQLRDKHSDNAEVLREATNSLDTLAVHYYQSDQPDRAIPVYRQLIARCEQVLAGDPEQPDYADWLILAHHVMSDIQTDRENADEALEHLVSAMDAADRYEHWLSFEVIQTIQRDLDTLRDAAK